MRCRPISNWQFVHGSTLTHYSVDTLNNSIKFLGLIFCVSSTHRRRNKPQRLYVIALHGRRLINCALERKTQTRNKIRKRKKKGRTTGARNEVGGDGGGKSNRQQDWWPTMSKCHLYGNMVFSTPPERSPTRLIPSKLIPSSPFTWSETKWIAVHGKWHWRHNKLTTLEFAFGTRPTNRAIFSFQRKYFDCSLHLAGVTM